MKNAELRNPTPKMANVWLYENFLGIVKCMLFRESAEWFKKHVINLYGGV